MTPSSSSPRPEITRPEPPELTEAPVPEVDEAVLRAQEQLRELRQQQELVERQKRELQALSQRQADFETAREQSVRKFNRAIAALERERYETERVAEHLRACRDKLQHQLNLVESIDPGAWVKTELSHELSRAEALVSEADAELERTSVRVNAERGGEVLPPAAPPGLLTPKQLNFWFWLKAGLAFTLPLLLLFLIIFGVFFYLLLAGSR